MTATYTFQIDEETRSLRVASNGTWTIDQAELYARNFRSYVSLARDRFGCARVLVDGRAATTSDPKVSKALGGLGELFTGDDDRLAVVTPSSLRKQQATKEGIPSCIMIFISVDAAKTWLFAYG